MCRKGTQVWDDEQKIMYAYTGDEWYGFETPRSMTEKVSTFGTCIYFKIFDYFNKFIPYEVPLKM